MRELREKIFPFVFLVLFLLAGIIALTQELDDFSPGPGRESYEDEEYEDGGTSDLLAGEAEDNPDEQNRGIPEWVRPARWFRSNAGGMALEEVPSRIIAQRSEYALVIDFTGPDDLPNFLTSYYDEEYIIEIRTFYKHDEKIRMQWIFRNYSGGVRLLAVFLDTQNETQNGFIEVYNEDSLITSELRFLEDGGRAKTNFFYIDGFVIRSEAWQWEEERASAGGSEESGETAAADRKGEFKKIYTDYYRYNRSWFLRNVERFYHEEQLIKASGGSLKVAFPNRILDSAKNDQFMAEKLNVNPDFFGDTVIAKDNRIIFTTDERGRILTQSLYDDDDEAVWVITNTWSKDRIVSMCRTEGDAVLLTEYDYDRDGNRIEERNLRNGVLERLVRTEDKYDYEELYMNDRLILLAVWEDGRKISETRVRNK